MIRLRLPGLSKTQQEVLFQALLARAELETDQKFHFDIPPVLAASLSGQGWWALMLELHDRPLVTLLGLAGCITYPLVWLSRFMRHWF